MIFCDPMIKKFKICVELPELGRFRASDRSCYQLVLQAHNSRKNNQGNSVFFGNQFISDFIRHAEFCDSTISTNLTILVFQSISIRDRIVLSSGTVVCILLINSTHSNRYICRIPTNIEYFVSNLSSSLF